MDHHVNGTDCPLCKDKLLQADMKLQIWFLRDVKPHWPSTHISWSYRDEANQEQAFKDGKSRLHFPNSAHNKRDAILLTPCAKALDLFQLFAGEAHFPIQLYQAIADSLDHGLMRWGGTFKDLGDSDHFELIS